MRPEALAKFPLLASLTDSEREAVADELSAERLAAGVSLFRRGDPGDGALFVAEGRVRVSLDGSQDSAELGAGEVLGALSLVVDGPREATAETSSRTEIWRMSRSAYRRLAAAEPQVACGLLENILSEYAAAVREEARCADASRIAALDPTDAND